MDVNTFSAIEDILRYAKKLGPGKYEIKNKYVALRDIRVSGKEYKKGQTFFLYPSSFREGFMALSKDQSERDNTIKKLKTYMDNRSNERPDIEFNSDFTKIKIYQLKIYEHTKPV